MMIVGEKGIAALASEAIELGTRTVSKEKQAGTRVRRSAKLVAELFKRVAQATGGLRGQRNVREKIDALGNNKRCVDFGKVTLILNSGGVEQLGDRANFVAFWSEVPIILSRHVHQLDRDNKEAIKQVETTNESYWTLRAVLALMEAPMTGREKDAMVTRVLKEVELRDAMEAAQDTGEDGAVTKLLSDQGNDDDEE